MTYNEKDYLAVLGFANEHPIVVADIGNWAAKLTTNAPVFRGSNPLDFVIFKHALAEVDEGTFQRMLQYRQSKSAFYLIEWRSRYFVIGEEAYSANPSLETRSGRTKYSRDYYGLLFVRGVVELFNGNPPAVINAFLAHPPGDLEHTDALKKSVHGNWKFKVNGKPIEIAVAYTNTFDEIVGGIHHTTTGVDGSPIAGNILEENVPCLVFDFGGGSIDLSRVKRDLTVDYERGMHSERVGVGTAMQTFKTLFDSKYAHLLGDAENGLSSESVLELFLSDDKKKTIPYAGDALDCQMIYEQSIKMVIRGAKEAVTRYANGFTGLNSVLLTGGGSAALYDEIQKHIFPQFAKNNKIILADPHKHRLIESNARGGLKIARAMREVSRTEADRWLKAQGYGQSKKR